MDLLAACANGLYLIKNHKAKRLLKGWFYGITWDKKQIYLSSSNEQNIGTFRGRDIEYIEFSQRLSAVHQILWYENELYIVNTGYNRIHSWNNKLIKTYQWLETTKNGQQAPDHLNSIWCDKSKFFVCEHRYGIPPAKIRIFDLQFNLLNTLEFYDLDNVHACGIHNVYTENNTLYTLSVNLLIKKDLINDKIEYYDIRETKDIGYLRGFARNKNNFFIGESLVSERQDRRKGNSHILILDNNLKLVDSIRLFKSGQCHDIRLLNDDRAHNMINCPLYYRG